MKLFSDRLTISGLGRLTVVLGTAALGTATTLGQASAQVGQTSAPVLASPLFKDAKKGPGGVMTLVGGGSVILNEKGGFLLSAVVMVPNSQPSTPDLKIKGSTGTATVTAQVPAPQGPVTAGSGVTRAAALVGALSGFGDGLSQPLVGFLNRADIVAKLPTGVAVAADPFIISAQTQGKLLRLTISPAQVPAAAFTPATHVIKARKPGAVSVAVKVYSDFQCPYCEQYETKTYPTLKAQLPADVSYEFHQFPLEQIHPLARPSAEASECAAQQGKFWEYHGALFADRTWLTGNPNTAFIALADKLKLNSDKFKSCLAERSGKAAVDAGLQDAAKLGLNGTPTVFVNGYRAPNPYDVAGLLRLIDFARAAATAPASMQQPPFLNAPKPAPQTAPATPKP